MEVRDLGIEHYRAFMTEIEDTNKWKHSPFHELEELIVLKCSCYQTIYRFNVIPTKIPMAFFTEIRKK